VSPTARWVIVAITICSWIAISNHCALRAIATKTDTTQSGCPFHSKPAKPQPQPVGTECCKILRAVSTTPAKTLAPAIADLVHVDLALDTLPVFHPKKDFVPAGNARHRAAWHNVIRGIAGERAHARSACLRLSANFRVSVAGQPLRLPLLSSEVGAPALRSQSNSTNIHEKTNFNADRQRDDIRRHNGFCSVRANAKSLATGPTHTTLYLPHASRDRAIRAGAMSQMRNDVGADKRNEAESRTFNAESRCYASNARRTRDP